MTAPIDTDWEIYNPSRADEYVHLTGAGGWCAPPEPLACGCPTGVLETGVHESGCPVLDIPPVAKGAS